MITTLLVIVASIAAGMIVSRVHPEYRARASVCAKGRGNPAT
jgi:hypothetical protein